MPHSSLGVAVFLWNIKYFLPWAGEGSSLISKTRFSLRRKYKLTVKSYDFRLNLYDFKVKLYVFTLKS